MKGNIFTISMIGAAIALSGCSSMFESRMTTLDQIEASKEMEVPKFMLNKYDPNIGVGYAKATDFGEAVNYAKHLAAIDICKKSNLETRSKTTTTSRQNSKGAQSVTAITGSSIGESKCKAQLGEINPDEKVVLQDGSMFHAFVKIEANSISDILENEFSQQDMAAANQLSVD
jgi:hypothetical protein